MIETQKNEFLNTIDILEGGGTLADLHMKTVEMVDAIRTHGKPGTLTLQVTLKPVHNSPQLIAEVDIKTKLPEAQRESTILYADDHNHISRRDPRQPQMAGAEHLRIIPAAQPVTINRTTGEITEP